MIPKDTRRRRLRAGPPRRLWRGLRSTLARLGALPLSWPHLIDVVFFGARGRHVGSPSEVVWRDGKVTLTRFGHRPGGPVVLVVHALVTKPWILDLTPTRSFVGALSEAGFDVFLLDWGDPDGRDARRGLVACAEVVAVAEAKVREVAGDGPVHVVGYCLGATVVLLALVRGGVSFASVSLIAPMVDFSVRGGLQPMLAGRSLRPVLALDSGGCVPAALVREGFHFLRPQALRTVWRRAVRGGGSPEERSFYAAMARWAWTHRRLPGAVWFDLVDLYRHNPLVPTDRVSPLSGIRPPMLVAVADRDHIVPPASSTALAAIPGLDVTLLRVASGHVSMLVGTAARTTFWPGVVAFIQDASGRDRSDQRETGSAKRQQRVDRFRRGERTSPASTTK